MNRIPNRIRILVAVICFIVTVEGLMAVGYLYSISAPTVAIVGTLVTVIVCAITGFIFIPTQSSKGAPAPIKKEVKPKAKPRQWVQSTPIKGYTEEPQNEEDEEEEEEDEILAMEMLDDVLDD